jgi:hypothetical protein
MGTKLSAQFPSHNMPTRSCSADLTKSCCYKRLYVSHKTIAGRAWINGIRFNNGRSTLLGALHRCFDDLFRQSLSAQLSTNEKADQRPYLFRTFDSVVRTAKVTVCWPRGDRAPCNGLQAARMTDDDKAAAAEILSPMDASAARLCACKASNIAALGKPPRIYATITNVSHASARPRGLQARSAFDLNEVFAICWRQHPGATPLSNL